MQRTLISTGVAIALLAWSAGAGAQGLGHKRLVINGQKVAWQRTDTGPLTISYAFVRQPHSDPEARNCKSMRPLDAMAERSGLSVQRLETLIRAGLGRWERHVNVRFERARDGETADVMIGALATPRGIAWADVIPFATPGAESRIKRGNICFNPTTPWKSSPGGDMAAYDVGYVSAHEIGHVLGLDHVGPEGSLMSFRYSEERNRISFGDIIGVQLLYGAPQNGSANKRLTQNQGQQ